MTRSCCLAVTTALVFLASLTARAQAPGDTLSELQMAIACAPPPAPAPPGLAFLRVIGAQDTVPRTLFGERDLLVLNGGTATGVRLAQQYFVRRQAAARRYSGGSSSPTVRTVAWISVVAANETTAVASVDHICAFIEAGDYLEPFAAPAVPDRMGQVDRSGELDFGALGRVLFGDDARVTAGAGEFMLIDVGGALGVAPGARLAIYRDVQLRPTLVPGATPAPLPLSYVGEGVVVSTGLTMSLLRILEARDAVQQGDFVVPRRP